MRSFKQLLRFARFYFFRLVFTGRFGSKGDNFLAQGVVDIHPNGRIEMGIDNWAEKGYTFSAVGGRLTLGNRNYFNRNVKVICYECIEIGNDCLIGDSVHIYDQDHNFSDTMTLIRLQGYSTAPVRIGSNVWIGAKATILKGVTIGDGAIIGANALVTKDVPSNAIVAGNPAQVVKMRA